MKMAVSSPNRRKTLWEKEILLVTSNFSFSHSVFKRLLLGTRKNKGLFGKGLSLSIVRSSVLESSNNLSVSELLILYIIG